MSKTSRPERCFTLLKKVISFKWCKSCQSTFALSSCWSFKRENQKQRQRNSYASLNGPFAIVLIEPCASCASSLSVETGEFSHAEPTRRNLAAYHCSLCGRTPCRAPTQTQRLCPALSSLCRCHRWFCGLLPS